MTYVKITYVKMTYVKMTYVKISYVEMHHNISNKSKQPPRTEKAQHFALPQPNKGH